MADGLPIGVRIARRRQALRMTQEDLARELGVSRGAVANWESGKHFPLRKLGAVEEVLGISLRDEAEPDDPVPESLKETIRQALRHLPDPDEASERVINEVRLTLEGAPPPPAGGRSGGRRRAG